MTEFDNGRGDYHTKRHGASPTFKPRGASPEWPNFICKNSCGYKTTEDSDVTKCPNCGVPLIRYLRYEVKS